jgi:hypothetical protein
MTELKTLKDLTSAYDRAGWNLKSNELRQEAIRWIKGLTLSMENVDELTKGGIRSVIDWIELFFNITDEDLK